MPRVAIKKKEYKKSDFSASIVGKLFQRDMTQADLGIAMGVTQSGVSKKIKSNQYSMDDLMVIFKVLEYTDEEIIRYMRT